MVETISQIKDVYYYMSLSYPIRLVYDREEGDWEARIPDLPGCVSDGADPNEAVENVADAQQLWIETCIERGHEVPLPTTDNTFVSEPSQRKGVTG